MSPNPLPTPSPVPPRALTAGEWVLAETLCDLRWQADHGHRLDQGKACLACRAAIVALMDAGTPPPPAGEDGVWAILYDDPDRPMEVFVHVGAEAAARTRYAQAQVSWNCHLLCTAPQDAAPTAAPTDAIVHGATYRPAMGEWCAFCGVYLGTFDRGGHLCPSRSAARAAAARDTAAAPLPPAERRAVVQEFLASLAQVPLPGILDRLPDAAQARADYAALTTPRPHA